MKKFQWNNKWRYLIVMVACVLMNELLYLLAVSFELPLWLDVTGTALAALVLEPAAGLLVGLLNDFFIAVTSFDASAILYYGASAAVALIVGVNMRREGKTLRYRVLTTILYCVIITTVLASLLTMLRNGGIPDDNVWELRIYNAALSWGWAEVAGCFFATGIIKILDMLATAAIVAVSYLFMPKVLKNPLELRKV